MTHRFVEHDEIERLAYGSYDGYSLLLADTEQSYSLVGFVGYSQPIEQLHQFVPGLVMSKLVFQLQVLHDGQFGKHSHLLWQQGDMAGTQLAPFLHIEMSAVVSIEKNLALIVVSVSIDETE